MPEALATWKASDPVIRGPGESWMDGLQKLGQGEAADKARQGSQSFIWQICRAQFLRPHHVSIRPSQLPGD